MPSAIILSNVIYWAAALKQYLRILYQDESTIRQIATTKIGPAITMAKAVQGIYGLCGSHLTIIDTMTRLGSN